MRIQNAWNSFSILYGVHQSNSNLIWFLYNCSFVAINMAATKQPEQASSDLNQLLEDALEDLLLYDDTETEVRGKPNIEESLKKITAVDKTQALGDDGQKAHKDSQKKSKANAKQDQQPTAGSSSRETTSSTKVIDEEEMNRFFASMTEKLKMEMPKMDPNEAHARISESVPQIFDLMQNLLSKELLYPALKDLAPKFDEWLQKNLANLSKDDRRRYRKQINKIHEIIEVFDDETISDQERFEKNLELMEEMQALGAPPEELTVPEGMNRCSIL